MAILSTPKITPCIWFNFDAEDAIAFYLSIFNGKILSETRCGDSGPGPKGSLLAASFELEGLPLLALNGGPAYTLTEAFSLSVDCDSQEEIDRLWEQLGAGGNYVRCGWLKDKFGLSWQIVPRKLVALLQDKDPDKAFRTLSAMMTMVKLDIAELEKAHAGL